MLIHTTASWPAREDRRAALVWLAIFWIFVGVGFGFDLHNYLQEQPPVPRIVHVHAIATTLWLLTATALVLMVETGNVRSIVVSAGLFALLIRLACIGGHALFRPHCKQRQTIAAWVRDCKHVKLESAIG